MSWQLILILALLAYSAISTFYCLKFALLILKVQDSIESSLDALDKRYAAVDKIMQRPLFFDSPEIRSVLDDISASKDAVLEVANTLSKDFEYDSQKGDDEG